MRSNICRLASAALIVLAFGCSNGANEQQAAADREKASQTWKLELDGSSDQLALRKMDIYLTEDDDYPEIFEIVGDGVTLVGFFPMDLHVGYEEDFAKLIGKPIPFLPRGGDPREEKTSAVQMNGLDYPVVGGTFTVEKITGKWAGSEGDKTVHGTLELKIPGADGERTVRGRFATNIITWG